MADQAKTNPTIEAQPRFVLNGYHVFAMVFAFFAVIISVNFTMAWFASSSWTGLVVKSSYVASQDFNKRIAAAREQKERGWQMNIGYSGSGLNLEFKDKQNQPLSLTGVVVKIGRPVSRDDDIVLEMVAAPNGKLNSKVKLAPGLWDFRLDAEIPHPYHIEGRLIVSEKGIGTLQ